MRADPIVGGRDDPLGFGVNVLDERRRMALQTELFHRELRTIVVAAPLVERVGQIVRQPLRRSCVTFCPFSPLM
jgi:hypothetical protein